MVCIGCKPIVAIFNAFKHPLGRTKFKNDGSSQAHKMKIKADRCELGSWGVSVNNNVS